MSDFPWSYHNRTKVDKEEVIGHMDPNATLGEIKLVSEQITAGYGDSLTDTQIADLAYRLATLTSDLDRWITDGGSLPTVWNASHPPF